MSDVRAPFWKRIRPEEYIMAGFALALAVLVQFGTGGRFGWGDLGRLLIWRVDNFGRWHASQFSIWLVVAVALIAAVWLARRASAAKMAALVRDAAPFLIGYLAYVLMRDLIPFIRPETVDQQLADMETSALGTPSYLAIPRAIGCTFLDYLLLACYTSHYYIPPAFAIFLAYRDRDAFRRFMLALSIAWAVGYFGYVAVPAVGPKYLYANYELWRVAPGITPVTNYIDTIASVTRDAFPSQHVAWTALVLWAARPYKIFFRIYAFVGAGLTLATLYFGFHYLIDLPAGLLLAASSVFAARWIRARWPQTSPPGSNLVSSPACASPSSGSGSR